ncbi:hypothetical protein OROGR_030161 [Orobanche gracilis]
MFDGAEYSSASDCCFTDITAVSSRKKNRNYKRRFSDEQIRSLEVTFESETKLEPRKKAQLAKDLGLQPRQVSIWFQNKRARWKTKQIEKDYGLLMDDYNSLASQFECLKKEKQSLLIQLQKLKNGVEGKSNEKTQGHHHIHDEATGNNSDGESINYSKDINFEANNNSTKHMAGLFSDDNDISIKAEFMALPCVKSPLTSSEDWETSLNSDDPSYNHPWWDFWC